MKKAVSVFFLTILCVLFAGTFGSGFFRDLRNVCAGYGGGIRGLLLTAADRQTVEDKLNADVFPHSGWIDLFGGALRVTGVCSLHEEDGKQIVRLKDDRIAFVWAQRTPSEPQKKWMRALRQAAQDAGASCLYVSIPQKTCPEQTQYCDRGAENRSELTDRSYTDAFAEAGFPVLDLHARMHAEGMRHTQLYFRTDHHWTCETALWAAGELAQELGLPTDDLSPDRFDTQTWSGAFLGSEGKHVGRLYCGMDDFSVRIPRFDVKLTLTDEDETLRTGSFFDVVIYREYLKYDPYGTSMYGAFLGGDKARVRIQNELMPQGKHILLIKDSFSNSMAPYLALTCGQLDLIDLRYFDGWGVQYVLEGGYDAVVVATTHLDMEEPG